MSERNYSYETPMQKRPRSGSEHTNYGSGSSQYSGVGVSQYNISNTGQAWSSHPPLSYPPDQSGYGTLAHPSYQRYIQQDPYPTDAGSSNGNMYYSNTRPHLSASRVQTLSSYPQQSTPSYESRTSRDAYQSLPTLQATAPMPESGLVQNQHQDYQASTPHTSGQAQNTNAGLLPNHQIQHEQEMQRTVGQYGLQSLPIHPSNSGYSTHPPLTLSETQSAVYGQNSQHDMKYGQNSYHSSHNMYSADTPNGVLSESTLPLDTGMLTRSFAPTPSSLQQSGYDSANGQGIDGFKQEPAPYPTPNQTSPMG